MMVGPLRYTRLETIVIANMYIQVKQQMSKDSAVQVSGSTILDEENGEQNQVKEKMKDDNTARASDGANDRLGLRKKELQHRMTRKKRRRLENARDLESENQLEVIVVIVVELLFARFYSGN